MKLSEVLVVEFVDGGKFVTKEIINDIAIGIDGGKIFGGVSSRLVRWFGGGDLYGICWS